MEQTSLELQLIEPQPDGAQRNPETFFRKRKPPAVLKHGIVKRHVPKFAGKVGWRSPTKRVSVLDTHAGAGYYEDGTPGSPAIAVTTADALAGLRNPRDVRCLFVEKNGKLHRRLSEHFAKNPHVWIAPRGTFEQHFDDVMAEVGDDPLFAFLDPFGFPPPFAMVKSMLSRSDNLSGRDVGPATELLINFSVRAVARTAAIVDSMKDNPAQEAQLRRLTEMMGGTYWEELCRDVPQHERADVLLRSYMSDLQHVGPGWKVFAVPVAPAAHLEPVYYLIFCTRSDHGVLSFSEASSLAVREYYSAVSGVSVDQLDLNDYGREKWIPYIAKNIETLLGKGDAKVLEHLPAIYQEVFGLARTTHLRAAVKQLHRQGITDSDGSGKVETMILKGSRSIAGSRNLLPPRVSRPTISRLTLAPLPSAFDLPTA